MLTGTLMRVIIEIIRKMEGVNTSVRAKRRYMKVHGHWMLKTELSPRRRRRKGS
jgi:hypothetical protein